MGDKVADQLAILNSIYWRFTLDFSAPFST